MRQNPKSLPFNPLFFCFFLSTKRRFKVLRSFNLAYLSFATKFVNMCLLFDSFFMLPTAKKSFLFAFSLLHYVTVSFPKLSSDLLRRRIISRKKNRFSTLFLRNFHRNFSNRILRFDTDTTRRTKRRVQQQKLFFSPSCFAVSHLTRKQIKLKILFFFAFCHLKRVKFFYDGKSLNKATVFCRESFSNELQNFRSSAIKKKNKITKKTAAKKKTTKTSNELFIYRFAFSQWCFQ